MSKLILKLVPTENNSTSCNGCYFRDDQAGECLAPVAQYDMCAAQAVDGNCHIWIEEE